MSKILIDREVKSVGGFAYVLSDRLEAFRQSVYCDMLFNWPKDHFEDFSPQLEDGIDLGASGENSNFCVSQFSPSYLNLNAAAFYLLSAKALFVFSFHSEDTLIKCSVLKDVEPLQIEKRLNSFFGKDFNWLATVLSPSPYTTETGFRNQRQYIQNSNTGIFQSAGVGIPMMCHVNTFASNHNLSSPQE